VYVICGQGVVDVLDRQKLNRIARVQTSPGARTGLYSAAADQLFGCSGPRAPRGATTPRCGY
jgi:hypothetical protein